MEVIQTEIEGLLIIQPKVFGDERGYFFESFSMKEFEEKVSKTVFVQDNESKSRYGVLRGLHFQKPPCPAPRATASDSMHADRPTPLQQ